MNLDKCIKKYELYLKKQKYSLGTIKGYLHDIDLFKRFLIKQYEEENIDIEDITTDDIQEFIDELILDKNYTSKSVYRKSASLSGFFNYMYKKEYISKNPYNKEKIELPNPDGKRKPVYLNEKQIDLYLKTVEEYHKQKMQNYKYATEKTKKQRIFLTKRDIAIIRLFIDTGLRVSELTGLTLNRVDLSEDNPVIDVIGKRNKERRVYLNSELINCLKEYLELRPNTTEDAFFVTITGKKMSERNIQILVKKIYRIMSEKYNIRLNKALTPHKLRHTFATRLLRQTDNLRLVQTALGHESVATTQIYAHIENEQLKNAMSQLVRKK